MYLDRRQLILGASALAGTAAFASTGHAAVDIAALHAPPAEGEMALGPETAKVVVVEYASASCPHCANFYKETFPALKKDYIDTGKIRFIFREFPHNQPALAAFMLARCAPKEKYFPLIDMFFEQQDTWLAAPLEGLQKIAQLAGFTKESFDACLKNEEVAKGIIAVRDKAEKDFGVDSIPTFFINGELLKGETSIEEFRKRIDPLL
ncbi:DsbA family protein [Taklimakanibacter albus]|uniref:DsbA family protein n=1 Tax=Taklimakanibacter albus TaxID=2800327 RepID=A0ACC5RD64_9HYPH|nr:DsbA family protein [Aestuariivirga sp. YIM B02566]MBK1870411.1 DsbA family protein [Aestuariivirga sp. YIM B02566]